VNRSVTTSKAGYWTTSTGFTAELGTPKVVDVALLKQCTATIVGTVRNATTLQPIAGAAVSIPVNSQFPSTTPAKVFTGADGTFVISNVLLGPANADKSIVVTGAATGFYNSSLTASLSGCGSTTELNFGTPPSVTSLSPSTGPAEGGTAVTILGTEFTPDVSVRFGTLAAKSVTRVSDTELSAVTPAGAGSVEVVVTNSIGSSLPTSGSVFTYELPTTTSTTSTTTTSTTSTTTTTTVPTTTTTVRPTTTTTTTTVPPAAACSPTAVSLDLRLDNGSTVRVDATFNVELFGLLQYWTGSIGGTLRNSPTSAGRTFLAGGATTDPVITGLPGSTCGARVNIAA
jgi:hypothetical protein